MQKNKKIIFPENFERCFTRIEKRLTISVEFFIIYPYEKIGKERKNAEQSFENGQV